MDRHRTNRMEMEKKQAFVEDGQDEMDDFGLASAREDRRRDFPRRDGVSRPESRSAAARSPGVLIPRVSPEPDWRQIGCTEKAYNAARVVFFCGALAAAVIAVVLLVRAIF